MCTNVEDEQKLEHFEISFFFKLYHLCGKYSHLKRTGQFVLLCRM